MEIKINFDFMPRWVKGGVTGAALTHLQCSEVYKGFAPWQVTLKQSYDVAKGK